MIPVVSKGHRETDVIASLPDGQVSPEPFSGGRVVPFDLTLHGTRPMGVSERFLRFAAECELMAKGSRDPKNKTVWRSIAERWTRCAELVERQNSLAQDARSMKHRGKPALTFVH